MNSKNKIIVLLVAIFCCTFSLIPFKIEAKTISQFEAEVKKFTSELEAKKAHIVTNEAEVAKIRQKINSISAQMQETNNQIIELQKEIDASNEEIIKKAEESKKIINNYQILNGNNLYLEYIFGATNITDMIYRMSVVEQLTKYNKKVMKELDDLIKANNIKKQELSKKQDSLKSLQNELETQKAKINADTKATRDSMPTLEEQIKEANANLRYYKNLGCGATEDIQSCAYRISQSSSNSIPSSGYTLRPTLIGYDLGGIGSYSGHTGHDIGSANNKNETIYPVADGIVFAVYKDNCYSFCSFVCNGNANVVVVKHNINNRYIYASYVHLSSVNVSTGQRVSVYTSLGKMGNTGCTSGNDEGGTKIHLHLEMSTCHWKAGGGCTYSQYKSRIIEPANYVSIPRRWNNR